LIGTKVDGKLTRRNQCIFLTVVRSAYPNYFRKNKNKG